MERREFIKDSSLLAMLATVGGCMSGKFPGAATRSMSGFITKPMKRVRIGFVGVGDRGTAAVHRCAMIPGVDVVALCDSNPVRLENNRKWLAEKKLPPAKEFGGEFGWRDLCQSDCDVVYAAVPWELHVPVAMEAMRCGKQALVEVPAAMTVDECWGLVETSEKTRCNCMMLENCCYGENEMLALNLVRKGLFGEIVYGEAGYIHDCRGNIKKMKDMADFSWRQKWYQKHMGNIYPTHGLGPVALCMDINRGDAFDYVVSQETGQFGEQAVASALYGKDDWRSRLNYQMGDFNNSLIRTKNGKSIFLQLNMCSPRQYSRINTVAGTKGILMDYPLRIGFETEPAAGVKYDAAKTEEYRQMYKHPMWKVAGDVAAKVGGHGGMDFIMDLRWVYCLQNGLPLDMDVYDLAAWSCIFEVTERSARNRSAAVDIPDFTRGAWKTAQPLVIGGIDLAKMGLDATSLNADKSQLNVR